MINRTRNFVSIALLCALSFGAAANSLAAESPWDQNHPRRDQVNDRLANQNQRINKEVKEGEMSKAKAARLHAQDHPIRKEERIMASQNNGHITKQEQRTLNQQESRVSQKIGK